MARFKTTLAAVAATGLVLAQPASAAVRSAAPVETTESLDQGSGMVVGLLGLLGLVFIIMALTDGDDGPSSP